MSKSFEKRNTNPTQKTKALESFPFLFYIPLLLAFPMLFGRRGFPSEENTKPAKGKETPAPFPYPGLEGPAGGTRRSSGRFLRLVLHRRPVWKDRPVPPGKAGPPQKACSFAEGRFLRFSGPEEPVSKDRPEEPAGPPDLSSAEKPVSKDQPSVEEPAGPSRKGRPVPSDRPVPPDRKTA